MGLFDFNGDRKTDMFETFVEMQMMAESRQEAIDLTGDDSLSVSLKFKIQKSMGQEVDLFA